MVYLFLADGFEEVEEPLQSLALLRGSSGSECEGLFFGRNNISEKKIRRHV